MQARYVILRVLQEVEGLVAISETVGEDGKPDLLITLDRGRIESEGKTAIGDFLLKLQVFGCDHGLADGMDAPFCLLPSSVRFTRARLIQLLLWLCTLATRQ